MSLKNPINHGGVFGQNFGLGQSRSRSRRSRNSGRDPELQCRKRAGRFGDHHRHHQDRRQRVSRSAFIEFQPKSFISQPLLRQEEQSRPKADYNRKQYGGEIGGPIIPGKLHFYVAAEGTSQLRPTSTGTVNVAHFPQNLTAQTNVSKGEDSSSASISAS